MGQLEVVIAVVGTNQALGSWHDGVEEAVGALQLRLGEVLVPRRLDGRPELREGLRAPLVDTSASRTRQTYRSSTSRSGVWTLRGLRTLSTRWRDVLQRSSMQGRYATRRRPTNDKAADFVPKAILPLVPIPMRRRWFKDHRQARPQKAASFQKRVSDLTCSYTKAVQATRKEGRSLKGKEGPRSPRACPRPCWTGKQGPRHAKCT